MLAILQLADSKWGCRANFQTKNDTKHAWMHECWSMQKMYRLNDKDFEGFALENRVQWSIARLVLFLFRVWFFICMSVTPAVPYLLPELVGCSVNHEINHGTRKLVQKKKKTWNVFFISCPWLLITLREHLSLKHQILG
jgi:hypothetical protein